MLDRRRAPPSPALANFGNEIADHSAAIRTRVNQGFGTRPQD
jgi:hypothetical protein